MGFQEKPKAAFALSLIGGILMLVRARASVCDCGIAVTTRAGALSRDARILAPYMFSTYCLGFLLKANLHAEQQK